jgi:hypothetical protein
MLERRAHQRFKTLKSGKVVFNDNASILDCVIRDLSRAGARLRFAGTPILPVRFDLELVMADGSKRQETCRVVWQRASEMGVAFEDPQRADGA